MIRAIVFDFDGVLVESVDTKTKAYAGFFEDEGEEVVRKVVEVHFKQMPAIAKTFNIYWVMLQVIFLSMYWM